MVLLVAGGFVVLGEVLRLWWCCPYGLLTRGLTAPLPQGITVLFGYIALAVPPLLILRQQPVVDASPSPPGGWLQGDPSPLDGCAAGLRGWLMVMPPSC